MTRARTTSTGERKQASSVVRGILIGCSVGFLLTAIVLLLLMLRNPFFVDSVRLAMLLAIVPAGVIGGLVGLVAGVVAGLLGRGRTARGAPVRLFLTSLVVVLVVATVGGVVSAAAQAGPGEPGVKLMLIGIDGGTWDVATDMMNRGELPNLSAAVQAGTSGVLTSMKPMYSTRIFTSVATGKVADKHGVVGLSETSADDVLVKRVWDIVHEQLGWDHGVVEWYLTWPPSTSPGGFVIPSMIAMTTETIPPELSFVRELRDVGKIVGEESAGRFVGLAFRAVTNGVRLTTFAELGSIAIARRSSTHLEMYGRQQMALVRVVSEATRYQLRRNGVEMLSVLYKSTDSVSHKYWRFHEPSAFPGIDPSSVDKHGNAIEDTYRLVDAELGELMRYLAPDGAAIIFSDHGFRASASMRSAPVSYKVETLLKVFGFSLSDVTYINMGGSFYLQPLTLDEEEAHGLLVELEEVFSSLVVSDDGGRAFFVEMVDEPGTGDDYVLITTTRSLGEAAEADPTIESPTGLSLRVSDFLTQMDISGTHAMNGIIVAVGEPFTSGGTIEGANVIDITPTALVLVGLPVADDMDGRPLVEAMTPAFLASHPVTTVESYETEVRVQKRSEGVESMSEETKERLRALGYIQ